MCTLALPLKLAFDDSSGDDTTAFLGSGGGVCGHGAKSVGPLGTVIASLLCALDRA